jgi:dihydroorotate dehydrogenase electron transfer subunit
MSKVKITAKVVSQTMLAQEIYSMVIAAPQIAQEAKAGQFISVYTKDNSKLLPRPISLCEVDKEAGTLRIVYRVVGAGTKEFATYEAEDDVVILGPLGNGFLLQEGSAMLIAGGIGIPPMVQLAKSLKAADVTQITSVVGYRNADTFLIDELKACGQVYIATEDGSIGAKGNVIDAIKENGLTADTIYSCGPTPMLRAVKAFGEQMGIATQISLEERMACGVGACLGCVCQSKEVDAHSHVHNKRICKDGPVFWAQEVEL